MSVTDFFERTRRTDLWVDTHWIPVLVVTSLTIQLVQLWRLVVGYARPPMTPDAAIFQHIGWYLTRGGRLYVDAWEPKLPLSFETTALLALLSNGDMRLFHLLNVVLMIAATVGIVVLVGRLTHHVTGDPVASVVAGLSMYLLPGFAIRPAYGFKAKYLLLFAGLLAIYLSLRDFHLASGVAAAASVGYWQLGAIFPLVVLGLALDRRDWEAVAEVVVGGLAFTAAMLFPVAVVWHSGSELVAQAVLIPLLVGNEASLGEKLLAGVVHFKWASPFVLLGTYGVWRGTVVERRTPDWWVLVGVAWFGAVLFLVDFDVGGYTDLIPGLAFVAVGLGLFVARLSSARWRATLTAALAVVVVVNVVTFGGLGLVFPAADTPGPTSMETLRTNERAAQVPQVADDTPEVRYIYWQQLQPETCHYRLSLMEVHWLQRAGASASPVCSDIAEVRAVVGR